mgnify:FL=1
MISSLGHRIRRQITRAAHNRASISRAPKGWRTPLGALPTLCSALPFAIFMLLASTLSASAQARLLSGEHNDFTRLALILPELSEWQLIPSVEGYRAEISPSPGEIDVSQVFDLIPRSRISNVQQDPRTGSLVIESPCDCHAIAFLAEPNVIAIDVRDGFGPPGAVRTLDRVSAPRPRPELPDGAIPQSQPMAVGFDSGRVLQTAPIPVSRATSRESRELSISSAPDSTSWAPADLAGSALASQLRADLNAAAEAGLIQLLQPIIDTYAIPDADDAPTDDGQDDQRLEERRHIDLRPGPHAVGARENSARGEEDCPEPSAFSFLAESEASEILRILPRLRAQLTDPSGKTDPAAALALSKAYMALSFGAEARALIPKAEIPAQRTAQLLSLTNILDAGSDTATDVWDGLQGCTSSTALWAFLGHRSGPTAPPPQTNAVLEAFFQLPVHLRLHIGPSLEARLRSAGYDEAAASIESNISALRAKLPPPAEPSDGSTAVISRAGPILSEGQGLSEVTELLRRTENMMRSGARLNVEDLEFAEVLTREHSGTALGDRLSDLAALYHLGGGTQSEGIAHLLERQSSEDRAWELALREGISTVVRHMSDTALLSLALQPDGAYFLAALAPDQVTEASERLVDLGFPSAALALLERVDETDDGTVYRAIARAALADGDATRTLALLAGHREPADGRIRADALSALGRYDLAALEYANADAPRLAARAARLSGDPEILERYGGPGDQELAKALARQNTADSVLPGRAPSADPALAPRPDDQIQPRAGESVPSLAEARDLADSSGQLQDVLRQILTGENRQP